MINKGCMKGFKTMEEAIAFYKLLAKPEEYVIYDLYETLLTSNPAIAYVILRPEQVET